MVAECLAKLAVFEATTSRSSIERLQNKFTVPQSAVSEFLVSGDAGRRGPAVEVADGFSCFVIKQNDQCLICGGDASSLYVMILDVNRRLRVTNQELIREVEDVLPLRKAAFMRVDSMLDSTPHKVF